MFYRVDYILAVLLAGFFVGLLGSRPLAGMPALRLARIYYALVATLMVLRCLLFVATLVLAHVAPWTFSGSIVGDLLSLLFGALLGVVLRRTDGRAFLTTPAILQAITMTVAFTFALAGLGKAFSLAPMLDFFAQSGYSAPFLRLIVCAEVLGAVGLLLPWTFWPAWCGLTIDMFGAILTHVHNGDPLNDSTGAIGLLLRLAVLGVLMLLSLPKTVASLRLRSAILATCTAMALCLAVAGAGSLAVRHAGPPAVSPAK